jgi:hypothetical protein
MDLYHRDVNRAQCVPDRDRSVGISAWIDQNSLALFPSILNPIDQLTFVIALQKLDFQAVLRPKIAARLLDLSQRRFPVNLGLTSTKQIQIRTIQDVNCLHTDRSTNLTAYTEDHKDREDKSEATANTPEQDNSTADGRRFTQIKDSNREWTRIISSHRHLS